jgi:hypothetical protein
MPKGKTTVRYTGQASVRSLEPEDFTRHGIEGEAVEFNQENDWTADVTSEVAGFLVGLGEFVKVTEEEKKAQAEAAEEEPEQQVPLPGEVTRGEQTPQATQEEPDSEKKS